MQQFYLKELHFSRSTNENFRFLNSFVFHRYRDGLHLSPEGNAVVHQELVKVLSELWFSAGEMPCDFPHHSIIDGKNPEKAFQQQCM